MNTLYKMFLKRIKDWIYFADKARIKALVASCIVLFVVLLIVTGKYVIPIFIVGFFILVFASIIWAGIEEATDRLKDWSYKR